MSIQRDPDVRDARYLRLVLGRQKGLAEKEIAASAGEESPEALYRRIKND
jgi:hypothetical protein